uniref:Major facilitator superfamily (MFS) profile domain-containing protein n=1 Tax=Pinguiococcus pyrenoidosus TaxID=172671 RepID=A0A7R9YG05_9STRA|mmetsp:Transcript_8546/g.32176  ORF Transcript_8546/g.32176 Transcript_8546/m.32176 type:complete len:442 (+) Transcript_8546:230-1555(+)
MAAAQHESPPRQVSFWVAAFPAIAASFCDYFGLGVLGPLLPRWAEDNGVDALWVGFINTSQFLGVLLGSFFMGRMSDFVGRKRTVLVTLLGDTVFFTLSGVVPNEVSLLVVRFFAGLFTPLVPSVAWITDASMGDTILRSKYMGIWALSMSVAFLLGTAVGGVAGVGGWLWANATSGGLALLGLVYIYFTPAPMQHQQLEPEGVKRTMQSPEFKLLAVLNVAIGIHFTGALVMAGLILVYELEASQFQTAGMFVITGALHMVVNIGVLPNVIKRYGTPLPALTVSAASVAVVHVVLCLKESYRNLYAASILLAVSTVSTPIFMVGANIIAPQYAERYGKNARGTILGASRMCFNFGQVLGPVLAAGVFEADFRLYFVVMIILYAATYIPWRFVHLKAQEETAETRDGKGEVEEASFAESKPGKAAVAPVAGDTTADAKSAD